MLDNMTGLARQIRLLLLALSTYDHHVLSDLLRCAVLIALCCAVLRVDGRRQNMLAQKLGVLVT